MLTVMVCGLLICLLSGRILDVSGVPLFPSEKWYAELWNHGQAIGRLKAALILSKREFLVRMLCGTHVWIK